MLYRLCRYLANSVEVVLRILSYAVPYYPKEKKVTRLERSDIRLIENVTA